MTSDEVRIGQAVASLRARLEAWGVDEAPAKATEYVNAMLREGWRPRAPRVEAPSWSDTATRCPSELMADMRANLAAARHPTVETPDETEPAEENAT